MENLKDCVIKAQAGDETSFQLLYQAYHKKAFYVALKISNYCEADAQDIVQDTFMEIHQSIKNLQKPENFKAWMIKILISKCSHKFRDNRDLFVEPEKLGKMEGFVEHRNYMIPENELNNEEEKKVLLRLVDQLKPKQKEVLLLQYFEHMSIKEMADVLDIPEGTVKTRIMYAKSQLKELVEAYEAREGRRLGFQADTLGAVLTAAFLSEYSKYSAGIVTIKPKRFSQIAIHGVYAGCIAVASAFVIAAGVDYYSMHNESSGNTNIVEKQRFQAVIYRGVEITNCRDAYYTLKEWAQNPERMALRPLAEKEEIRPVYESLKMYQGVYYEKLKEDHWVEAFENH